MRKIKILNFYLKYKNITSRIYIYRWHINKQLARQTDGAQEIVIFMFFDVTSDVVHHRIHREDVLREVAHLDRDRQVQILRNPS